VDGAVTLQVSVVNLHPASRTYIIPGSLPVLGSDIVTGGSISLESSDPFANTIIDLNLVSETVDVAILREAHRNLRQLFMAQAFNGSVSGSLYPASNVTTDEDLNVFITNAAGPYLHGRGSAGMSPRGASWGVVNPDYQVKGTTGLRIVDASIFVSVFLHGYLMCLMDNHCSLVGPVAIHRLPCMHSLNERAW